MLITSLLCIVHCSCSRNECEEVQELPTSFTRYWLANEGSWWIYKSNDTPSAFDTAVVFQIIDEVNTNDDRDPNYCYHIKIPLISHTNFSAFNDSITSYLPSPSGLGAYNLFFLDINWNSQSSSVCILYPPEIGFTIRDWTFLEITELNSINYNLTNVWHLMNTVDSSHLYFAPDVGLVRFIKPDKSDWNLMDYCIL